MELAWWLIESCMMSKNEEKKKVEITNKIYIYILIKSS